MSSEIPDTWPRDLLDVLLVAAKRPKIAIYIPFSLAVLVALVSLAIPNTFTARAQIMPPSQSQDLSMAMLSQFGVVGQLAQTSLGLKNPNEIFVALLQSDSVANNLIKRFDLMAEYGESTMVETRKQLARRTFIDISKGGAISIEVDDHGPARAAEIANAYVEELISLSSRLAVDEASKKRTFFEKHLQEAKTELARASDRLKVFLESNRLTQLDAQGALALTASSQLQAQIAFKEIEIASLGSFSTPSNPNVLRARSELTALRRELARIDSSNGNERLTLSNVPKLGAEYVARLRDVKYNEALFEALGRQYELARVEEAHGGLTVQIVDTALPPDKKSSPKRALITLLSLLVFGAIGLVWAVLVEGIARARSTDSYSGSRIAELFRLLRNLRTRASP